MALVAVISRDPRLTRAEWLECIDRSDSLARPKPRQIVNPFTRTQQIHTPTPCEAEILADHSVVGAIEPSSEFEEDGELLVSAADGLHDVVRGVANMIASSLDASLEWLADAG